MKYGLQQVYTNLHSNRAMASLVLTSPSVFCATNRYISAMGYGFEGYTRAEFRGVTYSCAGGLAPTIIAYIPSFLPNTTQINSPIVRNALSNPGPDCTVRLDSILDYFELFRPFWEVVVILLAYLGFFHIITYLGFLWLTKKEKR